MNKLATCTRLRQDLNDDDVQCMYELYANYYDATSPEIFRADLAAKSHVIELRHEGILCGFSTLAVLDAAYENEPIRAIFSGDTIIDHAFWGEQALVHAFCHFAGRLKGDAPTVDLYWLLISKGYRTYRYLSVFAHQYFPHHSVATPPQIRDLMEMLARVKFGGDFDAQRGIVAFRQSLGHLKLRWAEVREQLHEHPAVRFFLERNPRYHQGEELVCLTELALDNLRSFARRSFLQGMQSNGEFARAQ